MTLFPVDGREPGRLRTDPSATQRLQTCHHYAMEARLFPTDHLTLRQPYHCFRFMTDLLEGQFLQVFSILFPATEARCVESLMVVGTPIVFSHDAVPWVPPAGFEPTPLRRRGSRRGFCAPHIILRCANHSTVNFSKCSASYSQQLKRDSLMVVGTPIVFSHDAVPWVPPAGFEPTPLRRRGSRRGFSPRICLRCANHSTVNFSKCSASYSQQLKRDLSKTKLDVLLLMVVGTPIVLDEFFYHRITEWVFIERDRGTRVYPVSPGVPPAGFEPTPLRRTQRLQTRLLWCKSGGPRDPADHR
ncbi:hypothetical protein HRG_013208 [Hirsutella rhossiliensis]